MVYYGLPDVARAIQSMGVEFGERVQNMLGIDPIEVLVIVAVALIIFGPGKMPEIMSTVAKAIREFRAATGDLTGEFQRAFGDLTDPLQMNTQTGQPGTSVRADQAPTQASAPASPFPSPTTLSYTPAVARRVPTKEDPLADLMPLDAPPSAPTNGHAGGIDTSGGNLI